MAEPGTTAARALLREWMANLATLGACESLMHWDRETTMASGSAEGRGAVLASLAALTHRETSRADVGEALAVLEAADDGDGDEPRMLEEARRARRQAERVPAALERELAEARLRSNTAWLEARRRDDFALLAAPLARLLALTRRAADLLSDGGPPYDALLDQYEPGATVAALAPVLDDLRVRLGALLAEIGARPRLALPPMSIGDDAQGRLGADVARTLGYDLSRGAIGRSAHPMSISVHEGDVRITTRVDPADPTESLLSVMHECGHALYEQGLPAELAGTLLGRAASLGVHESQSRFWENHVGRDAAFWRWLAPRLRELGEGVDAEALHRAVTAVGPSLVRTDADEVTYNLHVVLRFHLERALVGGDLEVADLPAAWNDAMEDALGIRPPSDADGVLQDIHWPDGHFGYFPTYALGNLYAAQLAETLEAEVGPIPELIEAEAFDAILGFMRDRVHRHGARLRAPDLVARATGRALSADALLAHLRRRYLA